VPRLQILHKILSSTVPEVTTDKTS